MQGPSQDYVRGAGPFSQLESGLFCGTCQAGSHGPELGWTPWPPPEVRLLKPLWADPLEGREVHAGSRHLTTLPDRSSPVALSTFPPGVLEVKKRNYTLK